GGGQAHGVLQVEEVGPVPQRVQLRGHRAHDGHHGALREVAVDGLQALDPLQSGGSSHMRSRVSSSATGDSDEWARVIAFPILSPTSSGLDSASHWMFRASSTLRVNFPPSVCQWSRSPKWPRSLISMSSGMRYSMAPETIPLIEARKPWFCMSIAERTPARCAPAEMPTPSSSLARRTR